MWAKVVEIFKNRDLIGPTLRLQCPRHPTVSLTISNHRDFETIAPEGGCQEACGQRLPCGHSCELFCHSEVRHKVAPCRKPCERGRPECRHSCPKQCSDPCGPCMTAVTDIKLPCGHILLRLECFKSQNLEESKPRCEIKVRRALPRCSHMADMKCWEDVETFKCKMICQGAIGCGHHTCSNPCYKCTNSPAARASEHAPCRQECNADLKICSHRCVQPCHPEKDHPSCDQPCELRCSHSRCPGKCGENCVPCAEQCTWSCEHLGKCNLPCGAPCDRLPCNRRCTRRLKCGHLCPSGCAEPCPDESYCQQCCSEELKNEVVDWLEFTPYRDLNLDQDPIIVLPCKHFCSQTSLDGTFEMDKEYILDDRGEFVSIIPKGVTLTSSRFQCPKCRHPISQVQRYNRQIKGSILGGIYTHIIQRLNVWYTNLEADLRQFKTKMDESHNEDKGKLREILNPSRVGPIERMNNGTMTERFRKFELKKREINQYLTYADESNQPHVKVYQMTIAAVARLEQKVVDQNGPSWHLEVPKPDIQFRIKGNILDFQLEVWRNADILQYGDHLNALAGCQSSAIKLYENVLASSKTLDERAVLIKNECDQGEYPRLAVEIILLRAELVTFRIQASNVVNRSDSSALRRFARRLLDGCQKYFLSDESCRIWENAVNRAKEALSISEPFYDFVSQEEREAIKRAMGGDQYRSGVRWYQCLNGHPVCHICMNCSNSSSPLVNVADQRKRQHVQSVGRQLGEGTIGRPLE
jgi:hypothetical protein